MCPLLGLSLSLSLSLSNTPSYSCGHLNLLPASVFEASLTERQMFMTSQQQHICLLLIFLFCSVMHMQLFFLSFSQAPNTHRPIEMQMLLWWVKRYHQTPYDSLRYEMYNQQTVQITQENTCLEQRGQKLQMLVFLCCVPMMWWACTMWKDTDRAVKSLGGLMHLRIYYYITDTQTDVNGGSRPRLPSSPSATYLHLNALYCKIIKLKPFLISQFII